MPTVVDDDATFVLGQVRVDVAQMEPAVEYVLHGTGSRAVHLCNAYTISQGARDEDFREWVNQGDLNLADGMSVARAGRWLGHPEMTDRVCGPDLMSRCMDEGRASNSRHFLYGSTPKVVAQLSSELQRTWPGVLIVGAVSPPFGDFDETELRTALEAMNQAEADVVWVGLGTPKQDRVVQELQAMGSHTYVAVGAAFDFHSGNKKRGPVWLRRWGLEWVYRLVSEPRRLWRRYLVGNLRFLVEVFRAKRDAAAKS